VITQAKREQLGIGGMDEIVAFDQSQNMDNPKALPDANRIATDE
jgi:hypothetical protein